MEDLLSALLQIGQLDAGKIVARVTTFQLANIFERLSLQFSHQALEKGLKLRIASTRAAVVTDKALLERILTNLLANAIRYTAVGGVVVGCRTVGTSIRIEIWDSGRGIPEDQRDRIFDEFYQVPDGRRAKRPGLGLGLNIVHRLSDLLGHNVEVRSRPGKGSVFAITVPLGDVWQSEAVEPEISETVGGEFVGTCVWLVEDDDILRNAMKELLERWGMRVNALASEAEVQTQLAETTDYPDLIIADFSLRGQVGTAIVQLIRQLIGKAVPAVIVTADAAPDVVAQIRAAGLPLLIKPVSPPRLRVMMHNLLFEPAALMNPHPESNS
jgi:CheY-like chemotaxis protein/anti-sigma regulatory factor (Ser/Thr protein kinase)